MIHEIAPHKMDNQFRVQDPKLTDYFIQFDGSKSLLKKCSDNFVIPKVGDFYSAESISNFKGHYLFEIDGTAYFGEVVSPENFSAEKFDTEKFGFVGNRAFRTLNDKTERLGGVTAAHILHWESLNKFCGRCGTATIRGDKERSCICPKCGNVIYPRISPVVIVAVENGDKLLMARNLDNPNPRRFLISGFVEVGESLEQAAHREVREEAGIEIKNVRYFNSQPWPFSDSLIAGFTAELDGDETIHVQASELAEAVWVKREDIPEYETDVSISCCLIENFRKK